jgi:hypothetical protein
LNHEEHEEHEERLKRKLSNTEHTELTEKAMKEISGFWRFSALPPCRFLAWLFLCVLCVLRVESS